MAKPTSGRNDGGNYICSTGPDVCLTPFGSLMLPIPYFSIAFFENLSRFATTVKNNEETDFHLNTRAMFSTGHEPGTGKGVKVPGYIGMAFAKEGSVSVFSEGRAVVRDGDPAWINRPGEGAVELPAAYETRTIKVS